MECVYLGLSFLFCEMGIILVPCSLGNYEDWDALLFVKHFERTLRSQCCRSIIACTFISVSPICQWVGAAPS